MLKEAKGSFDTNPVLYINLQLQYHLGITRSELREMSDEEWAQHFAMLEDIRKKQSKMR